MKVESGRMETVIEKAVKEAAKLSSTQVTAAVQPQPNPSKRLYANPRMEGVHQRAAPTTPFREREPDTLSRAVTSSVLKRGGFVKTGVEDMSVKAIPDFTHKQADGVQVPFHMQQNRGLPKKKRVLTAAMRATAKKGISTLNA